MKTIFEQLTELPLYDSPAFTESKTVTFYRNTKNKKDVFTNPDEFITRKLNGSDYEKVTETISKKNDFLNEFFGAEYKITAKDKVLLATFCKTLVECNLVSTIEPKVKAEKSDINKKIATINAKLQKTKGTPEEAAVRLERVAYYITNKITPRKSFQDIELYNAQLGKK